jgi:hypothetical protein
MVRAHGPGLDDAEHAAPVAMPTLSGLIPPNPFGDLGMHNSAGATRGLLARPTEISASPQIDAASCDRSRGAKRPVAPW